MLKRVAVTGPESTGKSMLTKELAMHYHEPYVPEFAREYLKNKGTHYSLNDVVQIAKGQLQAEEKVALHAKILLFCDTDFLVTKIWCEVVFKTCPQWIDQQFKEHRYTLYLLCYPDIAWEPDPLRENPDNRLELFNLYEKALKENNMNYKVITGTGTERISKAINYLQD